MKILCFLLLALLQPAFVFSEEKTAVRVGFMPDLFPYEYADESGKADGYHIDIIQAAAREMDITLEFRPGSWAELMNMLEEGEIDVIPAVIYTEDRAEKYAFSIPHTRLYYSIFVRKDSAEIVSVEALKGKKVVVPRNGIMSNFIRSTGVGAYLIEVDGDTEPLHLLNEGKYDAVLYLNLMGRMQIHNEKLKNVRVSGEPVLLQETSFAVRRNDRSLLVTLDEGLVLAKQKGELSDIYRKWFRVIEPFRLPLITMFKYFAWIILPFTLIIVFILLWNRTLKTQVALKTSEINEQAEKLHKLSMHMQESAEIERIKISRDVHDALGQLLTAARLELEVMKNNFENKRKLFDRITAAENIVDESIDCVKDIVGRLRPPMLDELGLAPALNRLMKDMGQSSPVNIKSEIDVDEENIDIHFRTVVYRIVQEGLTNILRHANAKSAKIAVKVLKSNIFIEIADDGIGIDSQAVIMQDSFGLMGIKERVRHYDGSFEISGQPGKGTVLKVSISMDRTGENL